MLQARFSPEPHTEAIALIRGKPVVTREVFDALLPELRARAFVITGIEGAHVLQRVRDAIAALPEGGEGGTWDKVKAEVVEALEPHLGDQAERRAELLVRTHGFQAFQASNWRVAQEDEDTTHLQYLATEDERVRDSHLALNGLVLPKNDPFWEKHFPPWDWGCRCRTRPMNPDLVDLERESDGQRNPDDQLVLEGPALDALRRGTLQRGGQTYDVSAPSDGPKGEDAYRFDPGSLSLSLDEIAARYDPAVGAELQRYAKNTEVAPGVTLEEALGQPVQQVTRREGAIAPQESLRGELPLGPKDAMAFGRERADQIRRMEKQARQSGQGDSGQKATPWTPRTFTPAEIAARRALLEPRPRTYQEFLDEVPQVAFGRQVPEEYRRALADLKFWEYNAYEDMRAEKALQWESGGTGEPLARWSMARRAPIQSEVRRRRATLPDPAAWSATHPPAAAAPTPAAAASTPTAASSTPTAAASTPTAAASTPTAAASTPTAAVPTPLATAAPVPAGPPSAGLDLSKLPKKLRQSVQRALQAADAVHDDGLLPKIPLRASRASSYHGCFTSVNNQPKDVKISQRSTHPEFTTLHELGHFLDLAAIGGPGRFESLKAGGLMTELFRLADQTQAIQTVRAQPDSEERRYYLKKKEIWARAYAQFVAEESQDKSLLEGLAKSTQEYNGKQWATDDFKLMKREIRSMFVKIGWMK